MPLAKSQLMEAYEPGKCPECGAPLHMHLERTQAAAVGVSAGFLRLCAASALATATTSAVLVTPLAAATLLRRHLEY